MDESQKNAAKKAMLLQQQGKIKAVKGIDTDGNPNTVDPNAENITSLLNVSTWDTAIENFYKKFMEQANDPAHTGVWAGIEKVYVLTDKALQKLITIDLDPELLKPYEVDPEQELEQGRITFQPMDLSKIDLQDMAERGITMESLEPYLKGMSYGHFSNGLVDMQLIMPTGAVISTQGRVHLQEQEDGSIKVIPRYKKHELDLNTPVCGRSLPDNIKTNLENTGHGGELVDLETSPGKVEPCYLSVDKYTNTVEYWPKSEANFGNHVKGVDLTEGQIMDRDNGKRITLEKFTTRAGYYKDGHIQPDAANRTYAWSYDGLNRERYAEENKQIAKEKKIAENKEQGISGDDRLSINKFFKGQRVPDKYIKQWEAANNDPSLRPTIEPCWMKGLKNDAQGQTYNAWVVPRWDLGEYKTYQWKPSQSNMQKWGSTPAHENKTQVAVNSKGLTNEATKGIKEPLKQGQQSPTAKQKQDQEAGQRRAPANKKKGGKSL